MTAKTHKTTTKKLNYHKRLKMPQKRQKLLKKETNKANKGMQNIYKDTHIALSLGLGIINNNNNNNSDLYSAFLNTQQFNIIAHIGYISSTQMHLLKSQAIKISIFKIIFRNMSDTVEKF